MTENTLPCSSPLDSDTGFHLAVASSRVAQRTARALRRHDLRVRQYAVLALACEHEDLTQVELAGMAGMAASQVVALIDELEGHGLVRRQVSPEDRRRRLITATDEGRALVARASRDVTAVRDEVLEPLDPTQRVTLLACLRVLSGHDRPVDAAS